MKAFILSVILGLTHLPVQVTGLPGSQASRQPAAPTAKSVSWGKWTRQDVVGKYSAGFGMGSEEASFRPDGTYTVVRSGCLGETSRDEGRYSMTGGCVRLIRGGAANKSQSNAGPEYLLPVRWRNQFYLLIPCELFEFCRTMHSMRQGDGASRCGAFLGRYVSPAPRNKAAAAGDDLPEMPAPWRSLCKSGLPSGKVVYKDADGWMAVDLGSDHGMKQGVSLVAQLPGAQDREGLELLTVVAASPNTSVVSTKKPFARQIEVGERVEIVPFQDVDLYECTVVERVVRHTTDRDQIMEAVLVSLASHRKINHSLGPASDLLLYLADDSGYKPIDRRIVLGDQRLLRADFERLLYGLPDQSMQRFELANTNTRYALQSAYPGCKAHVSVHSLEISPAGTAQVALSIGPSTMHGPATATFDLKRSGGRWRIVKREVRCPM
jgi:hypothetical protein